MSSYWAGYSGAALVLTDPEFRKMMESYKACRPTHAAELEREYESLFDCDRAELCWALDNTDEKRFTVVRVAEDTNCDGATLVPYYVENGSKNVYEFDEIGRPVREMKTIVYNEPVWAIFSDRSLDGVNAFDAMPYHSYSDFRAEFECKLMRYLPHDFDWNAHLGRFSYAAYA